MQRSVLAAALCLLLVPLLPESRAAEYDFNGHVKGRALADSLPDNSVFRQVAGDPATSGEADVRLRFGAESGAWSFNTDYQAFAILGDAVAIARGLAPDQGPATVGELDDARRWFDLTHTISASANSLRVHRLDRLTLTWTSEQMVVRFGRQALSWGGGLFFAPFDIVNPFDPAAVDTEYKTGDDMLYAQYLQPGGNDLQVAWVRRRDPATGSPEADEATLALKYHGITGDSEYDVLVARNRGRSTIGLGGNRGIGGAVLRADLVLSRGEAWTAEALINLSYSWSWSGKNVRGAIEYYYNGWGLAGGPYDVSGVAADPELAERLARGETFTIGRNYLAAGITVEVTPLWLVSPNLFANLDDASALLQIVVNHSLGDNLTFLGALNIALGPDGSEFGGVGADQAFLSRDAGLFAQLAWYF